VNWTNGGLKLFHLVIHRDKEYKHENHRYQSFKAKATTYGKKGWNKSNTVIKFVARQQLTT
jgi:hypothetical protein